MVRAMKEEKVEEEKATGRISPGASPGGFRRGASPGQRAGSGLVGHARLRRDCGRKKSCQAFFWVLGVC